MKNELLIRALKAGLASGHEVIVRNYPDLKSRQNGSPVKFALNPAVLDGDTINKFWMPPFGKDGCNDLCIFVYKDAELWEYHLWYSDNEEDKVSDSEINRYLERWQEVAA